MRYLTHKRSVLLGLSAVLVAVFMIGTTNISMADTFASTDIEMAYGINEEVSGELTFILEGENGAPMPEGTEDGKKEVTISPKSQNVSFGTVSFDKSDIYTYKVHRKESGISGLTEDMTEYKLLILATEDGVTKKVYRSGTESAKQDSFEYMDFYKKPEPFAAPKKSPCKDDPPVLKKVVGEPEKQESFIFRLTRKTEDAPMPKGSKGNVLEMSVPAGEEREFGEIVFEKEGTYVYEISEVNDKRSGYSYDESVYTITYVVKESESGMSITKTVTKNGEEVKTAYYTFVNEYSKEKDTEVENPVETPSDPIQKNPVVKKIKKMIDTGDSTQILGTMAVMTLAIVILLAMLIYKVKENREYRKLLQKGK